MGTGTPDSQTEIFQASHSLSPVGPSDLGCSEAVCKREGKRERDRECKGESVDVYTYM